MEYMLEDLEQCDQVRMKVVGLEADLNNQQILQNEKDQRISSLRSELIQLRNYNDSLFQENLSLQVNDTKKYSSLRKSRNWWVATAIAGVLSAVAVHIHWKYGEGN